MDLEDNTCKQNCGAGKYNNEGICAPCPEGVATCVRGPNGVRAKTCKNNENYYAFEKTAGTLSNDGGDDGSFVECRNKPPPLHYIDAG